MAQAVLCKSDRARHFFGVSTKLPRQHCPHLNTEQISFTPPHDRTILSFFFLVFLRKLMWMSTTVECYFFFSPACANAAHKYPSSCPLCRDKKRAHSPHFSNYGKCKNRECANFNAFITSAVHKFFSSCHFLELAEQREKKKCFKHCYPHKLQLAACLGCHNE